VPVKSPASRGKSWILAGESLPAAMQLSSPSEGGETASSPSGGSGERFCNGFDWCVLQCHGVAFPAELESHIAAAHTGSAARTSLTRLSRKERFNLLAVLSELLNGLCSLHLSLPAFLTSDESKHHAEDPLRPGRAGADESEIDSRPIFCGFAHSQVALQQTEWAKSAGSVAGLVVRKWTRRLH
jgi:hypothetical protein